MNEDLWLTGTDPLALLADLHPMHTHGSVQPQTRPSRMYLLACARRAWDRLPGVCRALVALAEVYADDPRAADWLRAQVGPVAERLMHSDGTPADLKDAETELALLTAWDGVAPLDVLARLERAGRYTPTPTAPDPPPSAAEWRGLAALAYLPFERDTPAFAWVPKPLHSARLLREVYGNPCRSVPFAAAWRTADVLTLARQMYDAREFGAMPILADALQDAGCDSDAVLAHCRDTRQRHLRGCWALDLVLNLR